MNGVRALGIAGIGDREAPPEGPGLRGDEKNGEDRFTSILSRLAGAARGGAGPLDAETRVDGRPPSSLPDGRPRKREAGEEAPDDGLAGSASNALLVADRQVRLLPIRSEAKQEFLRVATEPGIDPPVPPAPEPIDGPVPAPDTALNAAPVDLLATAAPALAAIGVPDSRLAMPDVVDGEPAGLPAAEEPPLSAAVGGPAALDTPPPSVIADVPPGRPAELISIKGGRPAGGSESVEHSPPPELPQVTVVSREKHFAPAQRQDPTRLAIPLTEPEPDIPASLDRGPAVEPDAPIDPVKGLAAVPDTPVAPLKSQAAGPDTPAKGPPAIPESPRRDGGIALAGDVRSAPIGPRSGPPQARESDAQRPVPVAIVRAPAAAVSSTEAPAMPTGGIAAADRSLLAESLTVPEPSRAAAIVQEKPSAPARRFDPAGPAKFEPQAEPPSSPVIWPGPLDSETAARSIRVVPADPPPPLPIVPRSMPQLPESDEHRHPPAGAVTAVAPSATESSPETAPAPATAASGLGHDVLQRIFGAVIEAAGSAALSAAAPETTAGIGDQVVAPAQPRALTIRVDLHEHGAVHVRLALNGNALSLRMRADREEIAEQLRQDHLKLSDTLSAAGYDTEIIAIDGRRSELAPLSGGDVALPAGTDASGAENADRGAGGDNRRPTARQPQAPGQGFGEDFPPHDQEDHEPRNIAQRHADALYV